MSELNIRELRASYQTQEEEKEHSSRRFGMFVMLIPVLAAGAGFAYKPIMDMRNKNAHAIYMAENAPRSEQNASIDQVSIGAAAFLESMNGQRQAAAMINEQMSQMARDPETGLINLNSPKGPPSEAQLYKEKIKKTGLPVKDFILGVDAKHAGFSTDEIKMLKFGRVSNALNKCGDTELFKFYDRSNRQKYQKILDVKNQKQLDEARRKTNKFAETKSELSAIKTKGDAMKFIASGGAARHQQRSMEIMSGMQGLMGSSDKFEVKRRSQTHNKRQCMTIRTMTQSGQLNL